ncbi:MAG: CHASE2 domain-containing protein [Burkholderiales bacterium]|nr:CHASE2 domain-containing protein [Burkholderiales bacterium]
MTAAAAARPERPHRRRLTLAGLVLLAALAALIAWGPAWTARLQSAWFDAYQLAMPRRDAAMPVELVAIDEASLARHGQWPWPRTLLAELVRAIERQRPAAIGIAILMSEPDRLSPEHLLQSARRSDPILAGRLDLLPPNDRVLASAIADGPVVLGFVGTTDATGAQPLAPPILVVDRTRGDTTALGVPAFGGALVNVPELDRAAAGHGIFSSGMSDDRVRRAPLIVRIGERLAPSLATEMLRVALGVPDLRLYARGAAVERVGIGGLTLPTDASGQVRLHYARYDGRRTVSAVRVLDGSVEPERFERKLVVVGVTGLALGDTTQSPLGERMPGAEVHAQLLENLYGQSWLTRPRWAPALEAGLFAVLGLLLVYATPRWKPARAALLAAACIVLPLAAGVAAFAWQRVVFDAAVPAVALSLLFGVLLVLTLAETTRQRGLLERAVQRQREQAAYIAGELQAAKRIQLGFLPHPDALAGDARVEVAARMTPAREVGGDLYDYFMRDRDRLFFLVGDVAGKGLSASLFMAVGKALYKSIALRSGQTSASQIMRAADTEISRDNPEMFFITGVAGILDLASGSLEYCNAGHENPIVLSSMQGAYTRLADGAGPPLCTVDRFAYTSGHRQMAPGEVLCVVTDGVADAQDPGGTRYGMPRLLALLARLAGPAVRASAVVDAVAADVKAFAAGADPADDLTVLAVRWNGDLSGR